MIYIQQVLCPTPLRSPKQSRLLKELRIKVSFPDVSSAENRKRKRFLVLFASILAAFEGSSKDKYVSHMQYYSRLTSESWPRCNVTLFVVQYVPA